MRVEVDERDHVLPLLVPRPCLELLPLLEELQSRWLAEDEAGPEPVDRHGGDRSRVALPIDRRERHVRMLDRPRRVVSDVVVDEPCVDPGELALVRRRIEGGLGVLARCAVRPHHPLDLAQQEERLRARSGHLGLHHLLCARPRGRHVADRQQRGRLAEPPPCELLACVGWRQPRGRRVELRGSPMGSPPRGPRRRGLDLRRDGVGRDRRARREVASPLLGILHHVGEPLVELSAPLLGRHSEHYRGEQRVGEANPLPIEDEHARLLRLDQRGADIATRSRRPLENGRRRAGEGRGGEHEVPGALRQAAQALRHELLDIAGHRKRLTQGVSVSLARERLRHLEGEEGIASRDLRQTCQGRSSQGIAEPRPDQLVQTGEGERSGGDTLDALRRKRSRKPERELDTDGRAAGEQQAGASGQPAHGELERLPRRRVEPLHVVDRDEQRLPLGEGGEHADQRRRRRACVCRFVALAPQQRRRESPFLDGRQRSASLVEGRADEIRERGIRQRRLALRRTRLEDAERPRLGGAHGLEPDRGLADPCFALDHERDRPGVHVVEEASDEGELRVPTDDGAVHDASHAVAG